MRVGGDGRNERTSGRSRGIEIREALEAPPTIVAPRRDQIDLFEIPLPHIREEKAVAATAIEGKAPRIAETGGPDLRARSRMSGKWRVRRNLVTGVS